MKLKELLEKKNIKIERLSSEESQKSIKKIQEIKNKIEKLKEKKNKGGRIDELK